MTLGSGSIKLTIMLLVVVIIFIYLVFLVIKALLKYIKSSPIRKEKSNQARNLGEVLKQQRMESKMTQEFVAEAIGVSRQSVSKWENGTSDPSTTNLIALAKLFHISPEDLLSGL